MIPQALHSPPRQYSVVASWAGEEMAGETRIVPALNAQLQSRQDIASLVAEIIGSSNLELVGTGATSHRWTPRRARQLLLRIKIVFDIQRLHQTRLAFEPENSDTGISVCGRKCAFETTIYILHLGGNLESPDSPGMGKADYNLCRALVLETFLCSFRALCMYGESLTFEQEDLLRQKSEHLCRGWESYDALLPIEHLVFRHLVPETLDEIQDHDGQSNIHFAACHRFSQSSYSSDRTPFYRDPMSAAARLSSIRSARESICSILGEISEVNWVEGFWVMLDVVAASILVASHYPIDRAQEPHLQRGRTCGEASAELLTRISGLEQSASEFPSAGIILEHFRRSLAFIQKPSEISPFDHLAVSDRLKRSIKAELVDFLKFLSARDAAIRAQFHRESALSKRDEAPVQAAAEELPVPPIQPTQFRILAVNKSPGPLPLTAMRQTSTAESITSAIPVSSSPPPVPRKPVGSPVPQSRDTSRKGSLVVPPDVMTHESWATSSVSISPLSSSPGPHVRAYPDPSRQVLSAAGQVVAASSSNARIFGTEAQFNTREQLKPNFGYDFHPYRSQNNAPTPLVLSAAPAAITAHTSRHGLPINAKPKSGDLESSPVPTEFRSASPHTTKSPDQSLNRSLGVAGPLLTVDPIVQPLPSPTGRPNAFHSDLEVVEPQLSPKAFSPLARSPSPPPPPSSTSPAPVYSAPTPTSEYPEVLTHPVATSQRHNTATTGSISGASRASGGKKSRFFSKLTFSSNREQADTLPSIPSDIDFRFSSSGTSILLWTRRNCAFITRLHWPSNQWTGEKLDLQTPMSPGVDGSKVSIRLVEGGTVSVAALIYEGKTLKLLWFDQLGHRAEVLVGDMSAVPSALAVSRDDSKIALACGSVVQLYSAMHGALYLTASLPSHSTASEYPQESRRIQRLAFSVDSRKLVAATQEYMNSYKRPVYVRIWDCFAKEARSEVELEPVWLSLGYGGDSGLSGITYGLDQSEVKNSRVFLSAVVSKSYASILTMGKDSRNKHIDLTEHRIDCAAQAPSGQIVFKSGRHKIYTLDIRNGQVQELADFSAERAKLKPQQEAMALGMPHDGAALALWAGADGGLTLKWIDLSGKAPCIKTIDLKDSYFQFSSL